MTTRVEGLYVLNAWYAFASPEDQAGITIKHDYHINKDGMFFDDNGQMRDAADGGWKKVKGYNYPKGPEKLILRHVDITESKADENDFLDAENNGVPTPKIVAIHEDEQVVKSMSLDRALQIVAGHTHVHQAPDAPVEVSVIEQTAEEIEEILASAGEPGMTYVEPEPVDFHKLDGLDNLTSNLETNPKKARGDAKAPFVFCPEVPVILMNGVMAGGAHKYGPYNFRDSKVDALTYVGGIKRHLALWVDGEDKDEESNISHLAHIMANCAILIDAQMNSMMVDNRPITGFVADVMKQMAVLHKKYQLDNKAYDA